VADDVATVLAARYAALLGAWDGVPNAKMEAQVRILSPEESRPVKAARSKRARRIVARKASKPLAEKKLESEEAEETTPDESSLVKAGQSSLPEPTDAELSLLSPLSPLSPFPSPDPAGQEPPT